MAKGLALKHYGEDAVLMAGLAVSYIRIGKHDKAQFILMKLEIAPDACNNVCEKAPL